MMKRTVKKDKLDFSKGSVIVGKWQQTSYTVVRRLGQGMIGTVYLCKANGRFLALKISEQQMQMTTEVNVLKLLNEVQDSNLGPFLYEVDDWVAPDRMIFPFYVMEYIPGKSMDVYVQGKGTEWMIVLLVQLLDELEKVHEAGLVFGDLKKEHILIQESPLRTRCIDVGGMTKRGSSIKEYSEFYDRAYWQLGSRIAEPSYDLFAIVMIVLAIYYPGQFKRGEAPLQALSNKIVTLRGLHMIHQILISTLKGEYRSAKEMRDAIIRVTVRRRTKRSEKRDSTKPYLIQSMLISSLASLFYVLAYFL